MARQKVFVDGLGLVDGHFSGIGHYILGVLRGIDDIIDESKYTKEEVPEVVVVIPRDTVAKFKEFGFKHIGYKKFPLPFRYMAALWHRGKLPPLDLWCGRGTYIFPRFVGIPLLFSKSVLIVYDLSFELHREYSDEGNALFLSKFVRKSIGRSKKVVTISRNAQKEITDFYKLPKARVPVAYPATDPGTFYRRSQEEIADVKRKYGIEGNYILALSNLEPRKNLGTLVDAYCQLPKTITDKYSLLLVGVTGWKTEALFDHIVSKVNEGYNITRPAKYVLDKDRPAIISGAALLVYPSHYEGFGMPPLEALACGVPVIAADNSSLPEAVGSAGTLIDIDKPELLVKTIKDTLGDIGQVSAKALREGPRQAEKFSWAKSARMVLDAAKEAES
ncbi:MAG TPA: glycosyltransferase family 1 protein [Candidatus Saccharimonadales bacterium]|nr:glycosyltransferase family 1 protein [Candidatus Saccharimonadales bacterium]